MSKKREIELEQKSRQAAFRIELAALEKEKKSLEEINRLKKINNQKHRKNAEKILSLQFEIKQLQKRILNGLEMVPEGLFFCEKRDSTQAQFEQAKEIFSDQDQLKKLLKHSIS